MSSKLPKGHAEFEPTRKLNVRFTKKLQIYAAIRFNFDMPELTPLLTEDIALPNTSASNSYIANCLLTIDGKGNLLIEWEATGSGPWLLTPLP